MVKVPLKHWRQIKQNSKLYIYQWPFDTTYIHWLYFHFSWI